MKTKYKIIFLFLSVLTFASCEETFLKETAYNKVTPGNFYTTKEGIASGVNGLYATLRGIYGQEFLIYMCEGPSDLWVSYYSAEDVKNYTFDATSTWIRDFWNKCYITVNQCNEVIYALDNNQIVGLSSDLKKRYLAEAKFIRAHHFYHLVQQFGDVPMPLEPTKSVITVSTRTATSIVWEQIIADLKFSTENLPESYTGSDYGRVTKYAAMQNLSRVLLTVKRDNKDVTEALNYAEQIINSGKYSLVSNHKDLWDITKKRNSEVIFPVLYTQNTELNGAGNLNHLFFVCAYFEEHPAVKRVLEYGRGWSRLKPSYFTLNIFNNPNDKRYNDCFLSQWKVTETSYKQTLFNPATKTDVSVTWNKGDMAMIAPQNAWTKEQIAAVWPTYVYLPDSLKKSINSVTDIQSATNPNAAWPSNTRFRNEKMYPYITKHLDPIRPDFNYAPGSRDVIVFRLGETYLLAGEAAFLLGNNQKAADYINVIRRRAAVPGKESDMEIKASDVNINFILDERGRELIGEMERWYDLKRTGKLFERMNNTKMYYQNPGKFKEYHVLRPIPRDQLTNISNPTEFPQNPGYGN